MKDQWKKCLVCFTPGTGELRVFAGADDRGPLVGTFTVICANGITDRPGKQLHRVTVMIIGGEKAQNIIDIFKRHYQSS